MAIFYIQSMQIQAVKKKNKEINAAFMSTTYTKTSDYKTAINIFTLSIIRANSTPAPCFCVKTAAHDGD